MGLFEPYLLVFYALTTPSIDGVQRTIFAKQQRWITVLADGRRFERETVCPRDTVGAGCDARWIAQRFVGSGHEREGIIDHCKCSVGQRHGIDARIVVGHVVEQSHWSPGESSILAERCGNAGKVTLGILGPMGAAEHLYASILMNEQGRLDGADLRFFGNGAVECPRLSVVFAHLDVAAPLSRLLLRCSACLLARRGEDASLLEHRAIGATEAFGQIDGLVLDGTKQAVAALHGREL